MQPLTPAVLSFLIYQMIRKINQQLQQERCEGPVWLT